MAQIVGAFGVPHIPSFPRQARDRTPFAEEVNRLYGAVATRLKALEPDVVVMISNDHFHHFFSDLPIFCIGVAESTLGPADPTEMPSYKVPVDYRLAKHLHHHVVKAGFDVAMTQEFALDHAFMVPYHFLASELDVALLPVFIGEEVAPTPTAKRCFALGSAIREAIEISGDDKRIVVVASGGFSLDLGGLYRGATEVEEAPDSAWTDRVDLLATSAVAELVESATDDRMLGAGNIGFELLNWITMLGTFDPLEPSYLERHGRFGHAFGAWETGEP